MHRLSLVCSLEKVSVRFKILPILIMALAVLAVACLPTVDDERVIRFSEEDVEDWRTKEIVVLASDDSSTLERRIFSVKLPLDWDIRHARPLPNSWSGQLIGHEFTLDFQGGPMAVSVLDEIVGRGSVQLDDEKAASHLVTEEEVAEGTYRTLIRPQEGINGVTGMIIDIDGTKLLISGREMSTDQQNLAFAVFRSIAP